MKIIKSIMCILILVGTIHPMMRRPVRKTPTAPHALRYAKTHARISLFVAHRGYSQENEVSHLKDQIREYKISKQEFLHNYIVWDHIINECTWQRKCQAKGLCTKSSNCLTNGQIAYLALQSCQKRLTAYENELAAIMYEKIDEN